MKKLLLFFLLAAPFIAYCGDKDKLIGNWKEVSRTPPGSGPIAFKDTIKIEFIRGNEYVWQKSGGFIYKGTYKITDKMLDLGSRQFTILEKGDGRIKIQDESATYELVSFVPASGETIMPPDKAPAPVRSLEQMKGRWSKYKGTTDKTVSAIDYTRAIKMVDITGDVMGDGKLGMVFSTKDPDTVPSWFIESYNNQTLYCGGKDRRELKVIKCEDNELVLQEGGYTYFFRRFKQ